MSIRNLANSLKIDDEIIDIDGEDREGLGIGKIVKITPNGNFFFVKFENSKLPIIMNIELFLFDRAGVRGSKRCYLKKEKNLDPKIKELL